MFVPYMTFPDNLEVVHSIKQNETDPIIVHCEQPDAVYGFKETDINLDDLTVVNKIGFNDSEMSFLMQVCRNNKNSIIKYEKVGGVYNA